MERATVLPMEGHGSTAAPTLIFHCHLESWELGQLYLAYCYKKDEFRTHSLMLFADRHLLIPIPAQSNMAIKWPLHSVSRYLYSSSSCSSENIL